MSKCAATRQWEIIELSYGAGRLWREVKSTTTREQVYVAAARYSIRHSVNMPLSIACFVAGVLDVNGERTSLAQEEGIEA